MAENGHAEISNLVGDVVEASTLPAKRRGTSIRPTIDKLGSVAYDAGLLPEPLNVLIDLVTTPSHLDQASLNTIVRNLYPATRVSGENVVKVVGCLGHGQLKPSLPIQAALLRWLIMVYHVMESPEVLSQSYAVLFNLLDTSAIRPQLCHLLALVTRRKHVRPFRIQALLHLSRQAGHLPALTGLLRVYKDYYPEIIVGELGRGAASAFKHPDIQWRVRLDEIQEAHHQQADAAAGQPQDAFRISRPLAGKSGGLASAVPSVRTLHAQMNAVTLEEISDVDNFVANLEKLELPNQLAAVLADPLLQKLLFLRPAGESDERVNNWVYAAAQDVVNGDAGDFSLADLLRVLQEYVTKTKKITPVVLTFLAQTLQTWNGADARDSMVDILSYLPLLGFDDLHRHIFKPLEGCILDNTPESQIVLLRLYARIIRHWTVLMKASDIVLAEPAAAVSALVDYCSKLALAVQQTAPTVSTYSAILDFYEQAAAITADPVLRQRVRIVIPASQLVYILFFSHSTAVVSRLCNILACFKRGFEAAMTTRPSKEAGGPTVDSTTYARDYVNAFNSFLMDICNCLWRSRAFNRTDVNALGCQVPEALVPELAGYVARLDTGIALPSLFGLSHSPVLCLQAILCVRELEDAEAAGGRNIAVRHAGPVTQASLARNLQAGGVSLTWPQYRIGVLRALEANGLDGIPELMKNTMKILMNAKDGGTAISSGTSVASGR